MTENISLELRLKTCDNLKLNVERGDGRDIHIDLTLNKDSWMDVGKIFGMDKGEAICKVTSSGA